MGLKDYVPAGKHIGTAVMPDLLDNRQYSETIVEEFNSVTVEHHQKWAPMCAKEGVYDFSAADKIVDWAKAHGLNVKGHTLVWHVTSPEWLNNKSSADISEALRRHIYTTVAHFRGRVDSWDVVNESLAPDGSLARNIFFNNMGSAYIEEAFRWARLADPDSKLIYNDNKVEAHITHDVEFYNKNFAKKSDAMFHLVNTLVNNKTPISEVGFQAHFDCAGIGLKRPPLPLMLSNNINRYKEIGLSTNISEMDVRINKLEESKRVQAQCDVYKDTSAACFNEDSFSGLSFWGFTDKHSWVHQFYGNDTPLLFDNDYSKKPAYHAVETALKKLGANKTEEINWKDWFKPEEYESESGFTNVFAGNNKPDWELEEN